MQTLLAFRLWVLVVMCYCKGTDDCKPCPMTRHEMEVVRHWRSNSRRYDNYWQAYRGYRKLVDRMERQEQLQWDGQTSLLWYGKHHPAE